MTRSRERRTRPGTLPGPGQRSSTEPEAAPFSITLRDIEIAPAPTASDKPAGEELIVSDPEARPAPWLGDPEAERAAQRAARRAQVRKEQRRDAAGETDATPAAAPIAASAAAASVSPAPPAPPAPAAAPAPPAAAAPPAPPAPAAPSETPRSVAAAPKIVAKASEAPRASAAPTSPPAATPLPANTMSPAAAVSPAAPSSPAAGAAQPGHAAPPSILVLRAQGDDPDPLSEQLRAFGFDVQVRAELPQLPAPWPFAAVFVDQALRPGDGGDAIDLCNEVRECSRLPGVLKPVLVLVAEQLSSTNRVRAGLAGCNEIVLGKITRGSVARVLDTRGIKLPSDERKR